MEALATICFSFSLLDKLASDATKVFRRNSFIIRVTLRTRKFLLVSKTHSLNSAFQSSPPQEQNFADITRRVDILQRVMALISSDLELEPLLSKILDSAVTLIQATHGTIGLVVQRNNEGPVIRTVAVYNMPEDEQG